MFCKLCLEESYDSFIDIQSGEANKCNLLSILMKYFHFCFHEDHNKGIVCRKCWINVEMFHSYYSYIERVHQTDNDMKLEQLINNGNYELKTTSIEIMDGYEIAVSQELYNTNKSRPKVEVGEADRTAKKCAKKKDANTMETVYHCSTCSLPFLTQHRLYRHIKNDHNVLQFKCMETKCVESYESQSDLDEHTRQAHTRVACPHCDKMIVSYYLPTHIKLIHDEEQRIVCDVCGNVSNNARKHENHIRISHSVQQKFQCDICKSWLSNRDAIRAHMRRRHVERPVQCPICARPCANKNSLYKHKKTHTAEYRDRFKCVVCHKGFRDKTNLRQHSVVHNGDRENLLCFICRRLFRCERSLNAHRKRMHPAAKAVTNVDYSDLKLQYN